MPEWFSPSQIRFTRRQLEFLLPILDMLRGGEYPPDPHETGYTGGKNKIQIIHAHFENAVLIASEILSRLAVCGKNGQYGKMVEARYAGWEDEEIARLARCSTWYVDKCIKLSLKYLIGNHRRHCTLDEWVRCGKPNWRSCEACESG